MHIKYTEILITVLIVCIGLAVAVDNSQGNNTINSNVIGTAHIGWVATVDNLQGNNPVCGPCSSYGIGFNGPLEYTPYPEPLNDGAQNPGNIYVVYSVIDKESKPWWTQTAGVWQVWGPYEFKAGRNHILKFGPQDIVGMTEGPLPYYVEGTAAWLQVENVDYMTKNAYAYCIVPKAKLLNEQTVAVIPGAAECKWDSYTPDQMAFAAQPGNVFPLRNSPFAAGSYMVLVGPAGEDGLDLPPASWNTFGPYELKGGHKYKALIESPGGKFLRFEEDPADLLSYSDPSPESASVYARNNCPDDIWYAICLRPTKLVGGTAAETEEGEPTLILDIDTLGAVNNEPTGSVYLDLAYKTRITKIQTYHWNYGAGTESPGSILIVDMNSQESDGGYPMTKYEAYGLEGSGGAPNAYWVVEPDLVLEPGLYAIIDSGSSTWAQNDETAGIGVTKVWGYVFSS